MCIMKLLQHVRVESARLAAWLIALLALLAAPSMSRAQDTPTASAPDAPAVAAAPVDHNAGVWSTLEDEWMIMEIGGSRVGWVNTLVEQADDRFRTTTATHLEITRGDAKVLVKMTTTFIESAAGAALWLSSRQQMGQQPIETIWEFRDKTIKQTLKQGGRSTPSGFKAPTEPWLPPRAASRYTREQRAAGAKSITYKTLDPQTGQKLITVTSTHSGEAQHEVDGKTIAVSVWKGATDVMPIESIEYVDAEGDVLYQEVPAGFGKIVMRRASRADALEQLEEGMGLDVMTRTFAKPDKPIENSMKATTAKLKLTAREGTLPDLPSAASQRVQMSDDRKSAVLTVDINSPLPAASDDASNAEYTEPSTMLDYKDELVQKLAAPARDEPDAMARALKLRDIAHKRISKKGMSTAFANASETAKTRTGDCSEHGVLLAAMLRAQGIPSRVGMGLVYVDAFMGEEGIFGWHMWTQALIDGKWIDLDATLPVRYNAAHVLTTTSSLADGIGVGDMASVIQLLGNIDIEVIEVGYE
jgi:hypothetical protein